MYGPQVSPAQERRFTTDAESDPGKLDQAINHYGVIGHAQASARARRNGIPRIIRRDFNTVDGVNSHSLAVVDATTGALVKAYPTGFIDATSVIDEVVRRARDQLTQWR